MTQSDFRNVQDTPKFGDDTLFWGKHEYGDRRQVVVLYRVNDMPFGDLEGPVLEANLNFYLDYEPPKRPGHPSKGRTDSCTAIYELEGVCDVENMSRDHFETQRGALLREMKDLEDQGRL